MKPIKRNRLRDAITVALVLGTTSFTGVAFAQEAEAEAKDLDTIVVTGTRIKSQTVTASSPVAEIGREEFAVTGSTRVEDLVNQFPQMAPYFDSFSNNGAQGYPTANLRSLGPNRTLTLINGRRVQPGNGIAVDLSIIPAAIVQRVDLLTGGASAVYGADAVAGVVNFVLDTEFEGISLNAGYSAYQHNNDNDYIRPKLDARGFEYPDGNSGFGGASRNIDLAIGSSFADGAGHAMAWLSWRQNDPLFQGERDYSSCAFNNGGTACGGSGTAVEPNFIIDAYAAGSDYETYNDTYLSHLDTDPASAGYGSHLGGFGNPYNYAPINYYQRPEDRINFGASVKYEINEHVRPYVEMMFVNRENSIQIAESGTFFGQTLAMNCDNELLGTACSDLGIDPTDDLLVYVGKRNVEGGPRFFDTTDSQYRFVAGVEGAINDNWSYDVSILQGATSTSSVGTNDFVGSRVTDALLGCPAGSFSGCLPYNVWVPGGVTEAAASALAGAAVNQTETKLQSFNAYVTGDLGFGFVDGSNINLVTGFEWRKERYSFVADSVSEAGDFTGSGGPSLPLDGETEVSEVFFEAGVPVAKGDNWDFNLDLGYRYSDYDLSGGQDTWKVGFTSMLGDFRLRGGFNSAIRAPNIGELFSSNQIALWGGDDGCAGDTPTYTLAQCQNTGVTAAQYGNIASSPASQYNQYIGGNEDLQPEQADTWTLGFAYNPIQGLDIAVDYFDIQINDRIGTIGAATILDFCATSGNPDLCAQVQRAPNGSLWQGNVGRVVNTTSNFGKLSTNGIDLNASYRWEMLEGNWYTSLIGTYTMEYVVEPLAGVDDTASYDCAGKISISCQNPDWRSIYTLRYSRDLFSLNFRWRYTGSMDYINTNGTNGSVDQILVANGGKVDAWNAYDLSGTFNVTDAIDLTIGVNNFTDEEPPMSGATLATNANALGGYDQAGRFIFANLGITF